MSESVVDRWWPSRSLQRTVHLGLAVVLGIVLYSPLSAAPWSDLLVKAVVFPLLTISGAFMWRGNKIRTWIQDARSPAQPRTLPHRLIGLICIVVLFGVGHHVDHIIRGNHVGWPLIPEVTAFTFSLLSYPFVALGLYLGWRGRAGVRYWSGLFFVIATMVAFTHFGPTAIEPPSDIIGVYESATAGWFAFAWVVGFTLVLVTGLVYSLVLLRRQRAERTTTGPIDS